MHLKYIKLVILRIVFILGLCNFKFSFKIPWPPPPSRPTQQNYPLTKLLPHTKKNFWPPSKYFSKTFSPPQAGGGGCMQWNIENRRFSGVWKETSGMKWINVSCQLTRKPQTYFIWNIWRCLGHFWK